MTLALIQRWDQMGGKEWVSLLVLVVGIALVCYAVDWLIGYAGVPEPFRKVVRIIAAIIGCVFLIAVILMLVGAW